jgi:hypothetical protein
MLGNLLDVAPHELKFRMGQLSCLPLSFAAEDNRHYSQQRSAADTAASTTAAAFGLLKKLSRI